MRFCSDGYFNNLLFKVSHSKELVGRILLSEGNLKVPFRNRYITFKIWESLCFRFC